MENNNNKNDLYNNFIVRKKTIPVCVGNVLIGGDNPISMQSMCNTDTKDIEATINQIKSLTEEGCEIVRIAVPDAESADAIPEIKKNITIPVVADIHFNYRLAVRAIEQGADKVRINPGNIGDSGKLKEIIEAAKQHNIPIRIGVNSGSLEKDILVKYGKPTSEALVESAIKNIEFFEEQDFDKIIVSIKSSNVPFSIMAYKMLSDWTSYPLHVGITEAGTIWSGGIKSAIGIGTILSMGIGDTFRVSISGDPVEEIKYAKEILKSLELRKFGVDIIACPTCGRTKVDIAKIAQYVENKCKGVNKNIKVAIMGCAVNGPGEAREADIGIAAGDGGFGVLFVRGKIVGKYDEKTIVKKLVDYIKSYDMTVSN